LLAGLSLGVLAAIGLLVRRQNLLRMPSSRPVSLANVPAARALQWAPACLPLGELTQTMSPEQKPKADGVNGGHDSLHGGLVDSHNANVITF